MSANIYITGYYTMLKDIEKAFCISQGYMREIIDAFHVEMAKGLEGKRSSLKMLPAYVDRPTGNEKGKFICIDLGGTNFRVLELGLKDKRKITRPIVEKFVLKDCHIKDGRRLFDFMADSIKVFIHKRKLKSGEKVDIGFTFSFPLYQDSIASGVLVRWTKGFRAKDVEGSDVVKLLNEALLRRGLENVSVKALTNDTVGTLVAKSYEDPNCDVGVILGTGTNACYPEDVSNIVKCKGAGIASNRMIINIEWGNFHRLRLTPYDERLDAMSENPGEQRLEKMVSGMYLGEIARLLIKDLITKKYIFQGSPPRLFRNPYNFRTAYMSSIESDNSKDLSKTKTLLRKIGVSNSSYSDRKILKNICKIVSIRAARISASAMIAVITKMDPSLSRKHTIAIDGTVYEKYFGFSSRIRKAFKEHLKKKSQNIKMELVRDGSGKGAAIIAAIVS